MPGSLQPKLSSLIRKVDNLERRARLGRRHLLAERAASPDPVDAAEALVCLHATDPVTVFLSVWARLDDFSVGAMERALYEQRSLVKQLAMRRTLFVFPRSLMAAAQAGASERVAGQERRRLVKEVEKAGIHADGERWLGAACDAVVEALAGDREASSTELRGELDLLEGSISYGEGKSWGGEVPVGPRVLTVLSAEGKILRASNQGRWTSSRPLWARTDSWLGAPIESLDAEAGLVQLVGRWLERFGPGTEEDIVWWLGSTKTAVRKALAELGAAEVGLEGGAVGYLSPVDLEPVQSPGPWGALLPSLDPTTMGWKARDWYLGPHAPEIFDRNGNGGATAWWDGRIVGGWRQPTPGEIELQLLEDIGGEARAELERQAGELGDWLGDVVVSPRFPGPLAAV